MTFIFLMVGGFCGILAGIWNSTNRYDLVKTITIVITFLMFIFGLIGAFYDIHDRHFIYLSVIADVTINGLQVIFVQ